MKITVELTEKDLVDLVVKEISNRTNSNVSANDVRIETRSKQNYKSEWENAAFRARYITDTASW